jgi:hypothetical protein
MQHLLYWLNRPLFEQPSDILIRDVVHDLPWLPAEAEIVQPDTHPIARRYGII